MTEEFPDFKVSLKNVKVEAETMACRNEDDNEIKHLHLNIKDQVENRLRENFLTSHELGFLRQKKPIALRQDAIFLASMINQVMIHGPNNVAGTPVPASLIFGTNAVAGDPTFLFKDHVDKIFREQGVHFSNIIRFMEDTGKEEATDVINFLERFLSMMVSADGIPGLGAAPAVAGLNK